MAMPPENMKKLHSFPPSLQEGKDISITFLSTFQQQKGLFRVFFWRGFDGKGGQIFRGEDSRFLERAIINFTSRPLFDLLFTCRMKDVV